MDLDLLIQQVRAQAKIHEAKKDPAQTYRADYLLQLLNECRAHVDKRVHDLNKRLDAAEAESERRRVRGNNYRDELLDYEQRAKDLQARCVGLENYMRIVHDGIVLRTDDHHIVRNMATAIKNRFPDIFVGREPTEADMDELLADAHAQNVREEALLVYSEQDQALLGALHQLFAACLAATEARRAR